MNRPFTAARRHRLTTLTAVSCWLLLCLVPVSAVIPQLRPVVALDVRLRPYLDLIEQYRRGESAPAVDTLRTWTQSETTKSVIALMSRRTDDLQIPDVPAMYAAAMLHTDAAFVAVEGLGPSGGSFHLRAAADLLMWTVLRVPEERQHLFARRDWRLMVTRVLNFYLAWSVEQSLTDPHPGSLRVPPLGLGPTEMWQARAIEIVDDDADLELARGSLAEGFAYMNAREARTNQDRGQRALVVQCRQRAEEHFRRALALRPDLIEARLRLGRVLLDVGRIAEADVELQAVLAATADPRTLHLALLFLGEAAEKAQRFEEAVRLYTKAVDLRPACQAARVALAYASERVGDMDRARSVITWFLGRDQRHGVPMDDWTSYPGGQSQEGFEALDRLRASVVRR